jgi:hypothetical protein
MPPNQPICSLSAFAKQKPGNTTENSDTHNVINTVRMQKFPPEACTPGRVAVNHKRVCISRAFDRKVDRNVDTLQRTFTDVCEQDPAPGATGRTATDSHGQSMPNPPFGITRLPLSTNVFHPLHKPIEFLPPSTEIHRCLPVLLSVLLSKIIEKRQGVDCFRGPANEEKEPQSAHPHLSC